MIININIGINFVIVVIKFIRVVDWILCKINMWIYYNNMFVLIMDFIFWLFLKIGKKYFNEENNNVL